LPGVAEKKRSHAVCRYAIESNLYIFIIQLYYIKKYRDQGISGKMSSVFETED